MPAPLAQERPLQTTRRPSPSSASPPVALSTLFPFAVLNAYPSPTQTSYSSPAASQPCQVPPSRASPSTSALAKPKKSSWPADRIDVSQIPTVLDWSTLFHFLLPSAPEIKFGEKEEGSPRWSNWLESWYVAYDPLVWALMLRDDADDAADEAALRGMDSNC